MRSGASKVRSMSPIPIEDALPERDRLLVVVRDGGEDHARGQRDRRQDREARGEDGTWDVEHVAGSQVVVDRSAADDERAQREKAGQPAEEQQGLVVLEDKQ